MPVWGAPRPVGDGAGAWGCKKGELLPLAFGALAALQFIANEVNGDAWTDQNW